MTMTPSERAACLFVKTQADAIDAAAGRAPCRETQKNVAGIVRERFFAEEITSADALTAASAIDGDYNAGVEDAAQIAERDGQSSLAAEIRKLKKVTP